MVFHKPPEHGYRCTCRMLAVAVGCKPKTLTYNYCRTVLQKRWFVDCNHGCEQETVVPRDTWHGIGPIDPIKALLIINE